MAMRQFTSGIQQRRIAILSRFGAHLMPYNVGKARILIGTSPEAHLQLPYNNYERHCSIVGGTDYDNFRAPKADKLVQGPNGAQMISKKTIRPGEGFYVVAHRNDGRTYVALGKEDIEPEVYEKYWLNGERLRVGQYTLNFANPIVDSSGRPVDREGELIKVIRHEDKDFKILGELPFERLG
jgi:hypothetical protein